MADGQVTLGSQVIKPNVKKVRRLQGGVVGGFAGATADAFTLFERLEMKLESTRGRSRAPRWSSPRRGATTSTFDDWRQPWWWRTSTTRFRSQVGGDVIEPHDGVIGIGSEDRMPPPQRGHFRRHR